VVGLWDRSDRVSCVTLGYLEVRGVIARRLRSVDARYARQVLDQWWLEVETIAVNDSLVSSASQVVDRHRLRALDALHLAAALDLDDSDLVVATWDAALSRAARAEGLATAP
jgi:predicted nucleic acid-binding protein